jgi:hypothetical protein
MSYGQTRPGGRIQEPALPNPAYLELPRINIKGGNRYMIYFSILCARRVGGRLALVPARVPAVRL